MTVICEKAHADTPSRLEPAIKYFFHTFEVSFAFPRWNDDMINFVPMQVCDVLDARELFKFFYRANTYDLVKYKRSVTRISPRSTHLFKIVTNPQGDWSAPVPVSRDVPVSCIRDPIAKAVLPNRLWNPDNRVKLQQKHHLFMINTIEFWHYLPQADQQLVAPEQTRQEWLGKEGECQS